MLFELSATEADSQLRYTRSVAQSVVECYAIVETARAERHAVIAVVRDVGAAEVERVAQLSGSLIDAGCDRIRYCDVGDDDAALRAALRHARIADDRIEIG